MAGIIKSGIWQDRGGPSQAAAFNFEDITCRAGEYLERVKEQAASILAEAQQRATALEQQAMVDGQQAALEQAEKNLQANLETRLADAATVLQSTITEVKLAKQAWLNHWEQETVSLAIAIAERIIRREVTRDPQITIELVRESLQLALGGDQIRLLLNPEDFKELGAQVEKLAGEMNELGSAEVSADPNVSRGGCRLMTRYGSIDQTLESQLARIGEELV